MNKEELKEVLTKHQKWLGNEDGGEYADLRSANLYGADLYGADLSGADLDEKEHIRKGIVVQNKLTGWKKCQNGVLVKLEIPKGAFVFCINGSKCRTNVAKIVKIEGGDGKIAISSYDKNFVYKLGKTIRIDDFDCIYNVECSTGIHFFRTKKEASECNG